MIEVNELISSLNKFKSRICNSGKELVNFIEDSYINNYDFYLSFDSLAKLCRAKLNENLNDNVINEMLIQHLLMEKVFIMMFNNTDFIKTNPIAIEIEKVLNALDFDRVSFFSRHNLDEFYAEIDRIAGTIENYEDRQNFLNTAYENFFQGFAVKASDANGIVYTPQPIVNFMINSVEEILQREFGKSLADDGVNIIDPFVGTGNFITGLLHKIHELNPDMLDHKYKCEITCNEVLLLPYYIASANIENEFFNLTGKHCAFTGINLKDTFELTESKQADLFDG